MAGVSSTVKINDAMSPALKSINKALLLVLNSFDDLQRATGESFDVSNIEEAREELNRAARAANVLENEVNEAGDEMETATHKASGLESGLSKIAGLAAGFFGFRKAVGFIESCTEAFDTQLNSANQLRTVLANMVGSDYEKAYDSINKKAQEIQKNGMYGDEAMLAGAAEFATYFKDSNAIEMMMGTLADYAAGMSGGGALDASAMVEYATGLGKIMSGSYTAMKDKGFAFTDTQKAIIEGTANEAQIVETLGEQYRNASDDMRAAAVINQVISESWGGLYEAMSNTPQGKIDALKNTLGDIKETIAANLYPIIIKFSDYLQNNMPRIEEMASKIAKVIGEIMEVVFAITSFVGDNFYLVAGAIGGIVTATIAWKVAQLALNSAMMANPIFLVLSGVGLLVGLIWGFVESCGSAELVGMEFVDSFSTGIEWLTERVALLAQEITNFILTLINGLLDLISLIPGIDLHIPEATFGDDLVDYNNKKQASRAAELAAKKKEIEEAKKKAAEKQLNVEDYVVKFDVGEMTSVIDNISDDTSAIKDSLEISEEDLKYLRDIAEQEAINRFTTAEIKIDMQNNNSISSNMDIDGIVSSLEDKLYESMAIAAEGAY